MRFYYQEKNVIVKRSGKTKAGSTITSGAFPGRGRVFVEVIKISYAWLVAMSLR